MQRAGLTSRRGSAYLMASLALAALIAASVGAITVVVVAHAQRVTHQRDGLQALYLAEMGIEETLAGQARGERQTSLWRTVRRDAASEGPLAPLPDRTAGGRIGRADDSRLVVGSYEVKADHRRGLLVIRSCGRVATPAGRVVEGEIRVTCRRVGGQWTVDRWEQGPW
ncbi:MAG: hypothetical protein FJX75_14955 [Armatimonadetes bacterium]|nr:hypothetical protein [Armatimonadota bacterium]